MKDKQKVSNYEYYYQQKHKVNELLDFFTAKLEKAHQKELDKLVLEEVYSLSKAIKLAEELEDHIDILRHIQRATINQKNVERLKSNKDD